MSAPHLRLIDSHVQLMAGPEPISVAVERSGAHTTVRAAGEVDLLTVGRLQRPLEQALRDGEAIRLDLSEVEFIDSTGLRLLLEVRGRAARSQAGSLSLVLGEGDRVRRLLQLTGVLDLFELA